MLRHRGQILPCRILKIGVMPFKTFRKKQRDSVFAPYCNILSSATRRAGDVWPQRSL